MKTLVVILIILSSFCSYSQGFVDTISKPNKEISFENNNVLAFTPATEKQSAFFYLGSSTYRTMPLLQCPNPNDNALPQFINSGTFISRVPPNPSTPSNLVNSSLSFYSAPWDGSGVIEVGGIDQNGLDRNGLLINYFCHRNTAINTGWDLPNGIDGGTVFLGSKVDMQKSLKIGWKQSGIIDLSTSIEINQNETDGKAVKVNTWNGTVKAFSIERADAKNTFVVYGNGNAYFGANRIKLTHPHSNCQYQFDGKIGCKELVVIDPSKWADFVFDKDYELLPLTDLESFYQSTKHLPDVPSESDVRKNGIDVAEMDAILLRKIEELTLYIVQQQKEIDELKNQARK